MGLSIHVRFSNATRQPAQQQSYTTKMPPEISLTVRVNVLKRVINKCTVLVAQANLLLYCLHVAGNSPSLLLLVRMVEL